MPEAVRYIGDQDDGIYLRRVVGLRLPTALALDSVEGWSRHSPCFWTSPRKDRRNRLSPPCFLCKGTLSMPSSVSHLNERVENDNDTETHIAALLLGGRTTLGLPGRANSLILRLETSAHRGGWLHSRPCRPSYSTRSDLCAHRYRQRVPLESRH